jgi:hypothetical protein
MIVDPLDYTCDALIEVIEVSNEFDKAEVDEGVLATHDTAIDFFFTRG